MTRPLACILLILLFVAARPVRAGDVYANDNFRWSAIVKGPLRNTGLYQVHLNRAVLEKCSGTCRDLRLFDANNREIPYVIIENRNDGMRQEAYNLEVVSFEEKPAEARLTIKMPEKFRPIRQLVLDIAEKDFRRNILLEGSADAGLWTVLVQDQIYDFSSQVDLRKKHISFNEADFKYYRLTLKDEERQEAGEEKLRLTYQGLDFSAAGMQARKLQIIRVTGLTLSETETMAAYDEQYMTTLKSEQDRDGNTVISFETGLPFTRISFDLTNPYFYRRASLYSSETGMEKSYALLHQASLYRFLLSDILETKSSIESGASGHRFYRIVIENGSNPPLDIKGIRLAWIQKLLFFVALGDVRSYTAVFGNPAIEAPEYDLSNSVNQANWRRFEPEKKDISEIKENPDYRPGMQKDQKARHEKMLLTGIILLLVAGIGFWLYILLKRSRPKNDL